MYKVEVQDDFGICQLGEFESFDCSNIESFEKTIIDINKPLMEWYDLLKNIKNLYIVSHFTNNSEISNALQLIRLCRNCHIFITVITSKRTANLLSDIDQLKNEADVFLLLERDYHEEERILDPASYAISFLVESFDEEISEPWYDGPLYAFSKSGTAELLIFKVLKEEYDKQKEYLVNDEIKNKLLGKRLAFLHVKSGDDVRAWPKGTITNAVKRASGNMLFASWRSTFNQEVGKKTWVTAIVSNLDNPDNSYGHSTNRTFFQGRTRTNYPAGIK